MRVRRFSSYYGVDFSGAKLAGRNTWIARLELLRPSPAEKTLTLPSPGGRGERGERPKAARFHLVGLSRLEDLCGCADRDAALAHLVSMIASSSDALWGMDFPFGLPIEILEHKTRWTGQLDLLRRWKNEAYDIGLWCVARAKKHNGSMHIRRTTDTEAKTPFDCYHYRIIYQTFHGMRDVLGPLTKSRGTAILPFQYRRLPAARRVVVESCPSSTLKRLRLPHQNYKQAVGGPLTSVRRRTRQNILRHVQESVEMSPRDVLRIMRNPGGDALDAVIAALGAAQAFGSVDHRAIASHARYPLEGFLYV
jgi:hypothetical protein